MRFTRHLQLKRTPQNRPLAGANQVKNSAGGFTWMVDKWSLLDRFLILGTENGTFYVSEKKLTERQAENCLELIEKDGLRTIARVVEISESGRAVRNDAAVFVLALAAAFGNPETKRAAYASLPRVARTGTQLFQFVSDVDEMRGWGRGLRKAVGAWYTSKTPEALAYQALKYQQREGWSHRDVLRLAHPKTENPQLNGVLNWITSGATEEAGSQIQAWEKLKREDNVVSAAYLIAENRLPREAVPTELLKSPAVWEALLLDMPMGAMVRNLGVMSSVGLLTPGSKASIEVASRLKDELLLRKARVHPMSLLIALRTYVSGRGLRGTNTWTPVKNVVDALEAGFYLSFASVQPSGKRHLLALDVSGSMGWSFLANTNLSASEASAAMALVTMKTEPATEVVLFAEKMKQMKWNRLMDLNTILKNVRGLTFGATDCAQPMLYAIREKLEVDAFVVYTDNETWCGGIHPAQALREYREKSGIDAKLIVAGMTATDFTIADPKDPGMLDIVGFDASAPVAMREFLVS